MIVGRRDGIFQNDSKIKISTHFEPRLFKARLIGKGSHESKQIAH